MVYKKIGDKIPSLSSLLLAGALLTGPGCQNKENPDEGKVKDNKVHTDSSEVKAGGTSTPGAGSEGGGEPSKVVSPAYKKARNDFFSHLLKEAELDRLEHVRVIDEEQLEKKSSDKQRKDIQGYFQDYATDKYARFLPDVALKSFTTGFKNKKFSTFRSGIFTRGTLHKRMYCKALNEILKFYWSLNESYQKFKNSVAQDVSGDELNKLNDKIDALLRSIDQSNTDRKFYSTQIFRDTKNVAFPSYGPEIIQFIRDVNDQDQPLTDARGEFLSGIMDRVMHQRINVWVKVRASDDYRALTNNSTNNAPLRGAAISSNWKVTLQSKDENKLKPSANTMPSIDAFPNTGLLHTFNLDTLATTIDTAPATRMDPGDKSVGLTGGQLLFTLFRGNTGPFDFLHMDSPDPQSNFVKLTGNAQNFSYLVSKASSENEEEFAKFLHDHIKKVAGDLFCIPDVVALKKAIRSGLEEGGFNLDTGLVNQGGAPENVIDANNPTNPFGAQSLAKKLVDNILQKVFGLTVTNDNDRVAKVRNLIGVSDEEFNESNATFAHKVGRRIIKAIVQRNDNNTEYVYLNATATARELMLRINEILAGNHADFNFNHLVVYKDDAGKCVLTEVGRQIQDWIKYINAQLTQKQNQKYITYEHFEYVDPTAGTKVPTGFHIDDIRKGMEDDCKMLKYIISAPVDDFLNSKGETVDYKTRFPVLSFIVGPNTKTLDNIRLEYQNSINKDPHA